MLEAHKMVPVRFVYRRRDLFRRMSAEPSPPFPCDMQPRFPAEGGADCWILQTWIHLRRLGMPVELEREPRRGCINVLYYDDLNWKRMPPLHFLVAVQADRGRPELCNLRVVQNQLCVKDPHADFWIPHWPQPGLRPRDSSRGLRFEHLAYLGLERNLDRRLCTPEFFRRLADLGVRISLRTAPEDWTSYEDLDGILAVRRATPFDLTIKPPSKLINCWRAGVIPLMGVESAYQQVGTPGRDYLEVDTGDEVIAAIRRLKSSAELRGDLLEAGSRRSPEFSERAIAERWIRFLEGPARRAFLRWREGPGLASRLWSFPTIHRAHETQKRFWLSSTRGESDAG
ncbi:glycosyltransferase [Aquisphaera insulae]|uniref:glycosyltransferase n=1 Tax=Aquisphaera insulae TaxID=2712864 RepID=UPI0013E9BE3B|nr:hypothetical protein [Aquisphaera insulae]